MEKKILECSSKGDGRFSALFAKVSVNGVFDSIENHYQKAKAFVDEDGLLYTYTNWKEAKGKSPDAFMYKNRFYPKHLLIQFYKMLWFKYLKENLGLIDVLAQYDDYSDMFKSSKAVVCQADVIREIMKDRGESLYKSCTEIIEVMRGKNIIVIEDDIFNTYANIIGHQVNCMGVMGAGIAKTIKKKYPQVFSSYVELVNKTDPIRLLGMSQLVKFDNKIICNLFGQYNYGKDSSIVYTKYLNLSEALFTLKKYAKENNSVVALPFGIGCGKANGSWTKVYSIIEQAFADYYVLLYDNRNSFSLPTDDTGNIERY